MSFPFDRKPVFSVSGGADALPVWFATTARVKDGALPPEALAWARATGFSGEAGMVLPVPSASGEGLAGALFGLGRNAGDKALLAGKLARLLPKGRWRVESTELGAEASAIGYGLGAYRFDRYRRRDEEERGVEMLLPEGLDGADIERRLAGSFLARDLINTPANDMGPEALEAAFHALAGSYGARSTSIAGEDLLAQNFPMIHAVGRASAEPPRLLDLRWGREGAPKVRLVGKGVCFDTGGLDIKPASGMLLMKKDMGGAANVMGLALMIMDAGLDVDLRVLVPAVENSIAANAFRPGDVLTSRSGLTVEIGNTDAEGRLILADALALADEDEPDLMIDMATLTGAARVALGPDLPPFYTDAEDLAGEIAAAAAATHDPAWRLPFYSPYDADLSSKVADINNAPAGGFAGSITAALFLRRFVKSARQWAHFDIYGWNPKEKPQSPVGGEAQCIRALYRLLSDRYGRETLGR